MASPYLDSHLISPSSSDALSEWQLRGTSPAPTVMTRQDTPAPSATPKKTFMSRLFSRKTSQPACHPTSTIQTTLDTRDNVSRAPSRMETPTPITQRSASPIPTRPVHQPVIAAHPPLPRMPSAWASVAAPLQQVDLIDRPGAQTSMSIRTTATATKKPKTKRSFSAIASLFKASPANSESNEAAAPNPGNRRARRGTLKGTFSTSKPAKGSSRSSSFGTLHVPHAEISDANYFSRERTSTVISLPPQSPSIAMLFDASQAEAGNTFGDDLTTSPITYAPLRHTQQYQGLSSPIEHADTSRQAKQGLTKSRSTPDFSAIVKKGVTESSSTVPASPRARDTRRMVSAATGSATSRHSMALDTRSSPLKLGVTRTPALLGSPASMDVPLGPSASPSVRRQHVHTVSAKERSFSPAPSAYAMSTISKKATRTFLDQILDVDLGESVLSSDLDPWSFNINDDARDNKDAPEEQTPTKVVSGLSVKLVKQLRPDTAGTFGRPQTGNRPTTANRPTTGVSRPDTAISERPDTGMSTFLGTHTARYVRKPSALRLDGRMRRISTASANSSEALEEASHEDGEESSSAPPFDSKSSFDPENLNTSLLSQANIKEDSGYDDLSALRHLDLSLLGEKSRPLSTCATSAVHSNRMNTKSDLRPTTADTTHLPFDLPDVDAAFDPRASLGSLGRQSSVSALSDFEAGRPEDPTASQLLPVQMKRDERISMPIPATVLMDADATPKKYASAIIPAWRKESLTKSVLKDAEAASSSSSHSFISGQLAGKPFENRGFFSKEASNPSVVKEVGIQTEPPTPTIVMTFADAEVPLYTAESGLSSAESRLSSELAAAETARINDPYDPFGDSYFPPIQTLLPGSPFPPSSPSSATTAANSIRVSNAETEIVNRLLEQLEKETVRREALEYSIASLRESAGADLRRSDQKIRELIEENKALLLKVASLQQDLPDHP